MDYIDKKYLRLVSSRLSNYKEVNPDLINFRCVICGDSATNKRKARAYIYTVKGKTNYKCHNCGVSISFKNFLKEVDVSLFDEYNFEKFNIKYESIDMSQAPRAENNNQETNLNELIGCVKLTEISTDSDLYPVVEYAHARMIPEKHFEYLYATDNLNQYTQTIEKYKTRTFPDGLALVIPFFKKDFSFDFVQARFINEEDARKRFATIEVIDNGIKLFGLRDINFAETVYVLEGPIDSMCTKNSLCTAGAGHSSIIDYLIQFTPIENIVFVYDNDYKINKDVMKFLKDKIQMGAGVILYDADFKFKDINHSITEGYFAYSEIPSYLRKRTFYGLNALAELLNK